MLSTFPEILFLAPVAVALLRIALGGYLAYAAWHHIAESDTVLRIAAVLEAGIAIALLAGLRVQAVAILAALVVIAMIASPRIRRYPMSTLILLLLLAISLVVTGAGAFAFDLPL
jgi:hypothetical protein